MKIDLTFLWARQHVAPVEWVVTEEIRDIIAQQEERAEDRIDDVVYETVSELAQALHETNIETKVRFLAFMGIQPAVVLADIKKKLEET